ncbi:hypothetical protein L6452_28975 [Arctium lappa]|uniref:Uncharacterized protein n=1 Tax=Arctium lappa TaxID=4217 RepID=A0ACB8ZH01_ARCLA|nr:hypothetical protein L6452_28975 [Arctium lappa]
MRQIDFAQVIFDSLVTAITPPRTDNVALPRFISLIITKKLSVQLRADTDLSEPNIVYDLPISQISKQTIFKAIKPTDTPLTPGMISFLSSPNPIWGTLVESGTEGASLSQNASKSVDSSTPKSTRAKSVAIKKKKATGNVALASMTMPPKQPSVTAPVISSPSVKRRGSKSPHMARSKRLRKPMSEPHLPSTDSQKSAEVEISPVRPQGSA